MKRQWKKAIAMLSIFFILFASFAPSFAYATENVNGDVLRDGEYSIGFEVVQPNGSKSTMDGNTEKPAKLFVEDGKKKVHLTLTSSDMVQAFQVKKDGQYVDAEVVSEDTEAQKRVVAFEIADLNSNVKAHTHVIVPPIPGVFPGYDSWYYVEIKFDKDSLVAVNVPEPPPAEQEKPVEETPVQEDPKEEEPVEEPVQEDPKEGQPENPGLSDGHYTIQFEALRADNDNQSSMGERFEKPGKLKVENGKNLVSLKVVNTQHLTGLELQKADGTWVDYTTGFEVTDFEVEDWAIAVNAKVSMEVPMGPGNVYKNTQPFRIVFNASSIQAVETAPIQPENPGLSDGHYTIQFEALRADNDNKSSMGERFEKPAKLKVENGKNLVSLKVVNTQHLTGLELQKADGTWVDYTTGFEVTDFEVEDFAVAVNAKVSMEVPMGPGNVYKNTQPFRIVFDESSVEVAEPAPAPSQPEEPVEEPVQEDPKVEEPKVEDPKQEQPKQEPVQTTRSVDYTIYKPNTTEVSMVDNNFIKLGNIQTKDGKDIVTLQLNTDNTSIVGFEVEQNGKYVSVLKNQVVEFEVSDFTKRTKAKVEVSLPAANYSGKYDVEIQFGKITEKPTETEKPNKEVIRDINDLKFDNVKKVYELTGNIRAEVTVSAEVINQLDPTGKLAIPVGNTVKALFPVSLIQGKGDITFNIEKASEAITSRNKDALSELYKFMITTGTGEKITQFGNTPVTLVFTVDPSKVDDWNLLRTVFINQNGEKAEFITPKAVNKQTREVVADVKHFSVYGVFEQQKVTNPAPVSTVPSEPTEHTIDFTIYKPGTNEVSQSNDTFIRPAKLIVRNDKYFVTLELADKQSPTIGFEVLQNGNYINILKDGVAEFEVKDLTQRFPAKVEVSIPAANYYGKYDIEIAFDVNSIDPDLPNPPKESPNEGSNSPVPVAPSNPTDNPNFDRNADGGSEKVSKTPGSEKKVVNTKTSDPLQIGLISLYAFLLAASLVFLVRKYRIGTL
ncbi:MAG: NEAT domain-containing protein [Bacillaceae bacterium]|nr:NEAT domain-containing protein [Bacillaceae bacterium]